MKKLVLIISIVLFSITSFARTYDVRKFGAVGDGLAIDSPAINAAIKAASKKKGSTVLFPKGVYKCLSIRLESNVTLLFEKGTVIKAAMYTEGERYDDAEPNPWDKYQDFGHSHWKNSLIWGIDIENVTICGEGLIDGEFLSDGFTKYLAATTDIECDFVLDKGVANKAIALKECRNITLKDFTIDEGGHFCILATGVDGLTISGIKADTGRDGIDIDCCTDVLIENCTINSPWDDAIVMKSSYALGRYKACENITIRGCHISGYATGSMLSGERLEVKPIVGHKNPLARSSGRIKFGTESSGGFKHVRVSDCTLTYCGGLHVESTDGGDACDIRFENITLNECWDSPVFIMIGSRLRSPEGCRLGTIKDIHFSNIISKNARAEYGLIITGHKESLLENITFTDCSFHSKGGISPAPILKPVLEISKEYPDPKSFGTMPSKGIFVRHARDVKMENVSFDFAAKDDRPLIIRDDVYGFSAKGTQFDFPVKSYNNKYGHTLTKDGDKYSFGYEGELKKLIPDLYTLEDVYIPYDAPSADVVDKVAASTVRSEDFVYKTTKDGRNLKLTVDYAENRQNAPVIVQIHGGSWLSGNRNAMKDFTRTLAARYGITGVRIEYSHADQDGVRMQDTIDDVLDAISYIRRHSAELNIDPTRVALMGQSAGAHLAAAAAVRLNDIKLLVGWYGPYDAPYHFAKPKRNNPAGKFYQRHAEFTFHYDDAYLESVSPLHQVPEKVNFKAFLLQGTGDVSVNKVNAERFSEALRKAASPDVVMTYYPYASHFVHNSMYNDEAYNDTLNYIINNL